MQFLHVLFALFCLCYYSDIAYALPFELNKIDWETQYTDYPQNFIRGEVFANNSSIYFEDIKSGLLDKVAGHETNKISYGFSLSDLKLKNIQFEVDFSSIEHDIVKEKKQFGNNYHITYPLAFADTIVNDFCDYFSKELGKYEKEVVTNSEPIGEEGSSPQLTMPKFVQYKWSTPNMRVLMHVITTELDFGSEKVTDKEVKVLIDKKVRE